MNLQTTTVSHFLATPCGPIQVTNRLQRLVAADAQVADCLIERFGFLGAIFLRSGWQASTIGGAVG